MRGHDAKKTAVAEAFDSLAYAAEPFASGGMTRKAKTREREIVARMLPGGANGNLALDAGCGQGGYLDALLRNGYRVVGLDIAPRMLHVCRRKFPLAELVLADLEWLPVREGAFHLILCIDTSEYVLPTSMDSIVKALVKALKPGGMIILDVHNKYSPFFYVRRWRGDLKELHSVSQIVRALERAGAQVVEVRSVLPIKLLSPIVLLKARRTAASRTMKEHYET